MAQAEYTILIVEDDPTIAAAVQGHMQKWGFATACVEDFSAVLSDFQRVQPHLVILDISLPRYNGFYWCQEIRKTSQVPILFLTSHTENMDVVMAMNMGGDDYITKPFSVEVLIAKVQALMRRAYQYDVEHKALQAQGAIFQEMAGSLAYDGQEIDLTKNESRIVLLLMKRKNEVVTRDELMRALWEDEHFIDENTLTVNINRLRKKLAGYGLEDYIQTKKGEGYIIRD